MTFRLHFGLKVGACLLSCLAGSGPATAADGPPAPAEVVLAWNETAEATINLPPEAEGTPEELRPILHADLATVQLAVYDAVMAITPTHRPYAYVSKGVPAGASQEAAVVEAAYRVLRGLFPHRAAKYQPAYDAYLAAAPEGPARAAGMAVGAEAAAALLAARAADGRSVVLPPYVPGSAPGQYRGSNPVFRFLPALRPFALSSNAQFRAPGPPALGSAAYAADFEETRRLGGAASTQRSAGQTEIARFHTEPPVRFWPRNFRALAAAPLGLAEQARLLAMLWLTQADATSACFESKYHYQFWRPLSAIPLADTDGNGATAPDLAWTPMVPTPPHPEYPAAHGCVSGAVAETLRQFHGRGNVAFDFNSTVTASTHHYATVDELVEEVKLARIAGGMHFRTSTVDGAALGTAVAKWALANQFQAR